MIHSYNTLVNALDQFYSNHLTLRRFTCSFFEQMENFSTKDNTFPILYAIPNDVSFLENIDEFSFRVYCVDILQKDRSNEQSILNETLLVLRDLTNWMRLDKDVDLNVLNTPRAIPVNNFLTEFTTGWYVDIIIEASVNTTDCSIPFSSNFIYSGTTCPPGTATAFLTCETLSACQSFIDLDNRVTYLESLTGSSTQNYYTTGATLNGYVASFDRNDLLSAYTLDLSSLSGVPDTNTFVTGFTYDNVNELSIKRNDGIDYNIIMNSFSASTLSGGSLNLSSISNSTTAITYNDLVINSNGDVVTNKLFYIGVNFEALETWTYVAPEIFKINSIDNPSGLTYTLLNNGTAYTLSNTINLYDTIQLSGVSALGFLKLNSELL